jgi:hypothetical protein
MWKWLKRNKQFFQNNKRIATRNRGYFFCNLTTEIGEEFNRRVRRELFTAKNLEDNA